MKIFILFCVFVIFYSQSAFIYRYTSVYLFDLCSEQKVNYVQTWQFILLLSNNNISIYPYYNEIISIDSDRFGFIARYSYIRVK